MSRTMRKQERTVAGVKFPAAAFAFVPDPELPSTWKLRLFDTPEDARAGRPSVRLTAAAVLALSPSGFRGNRVQLPPGALGPVKRLVAAAWLKARQQAGQQVGNADVPTVLKSVLTVSEQPQTQEKAEDMSDTREAVLRLARGLPALAARDGTPEAVAGVEDLFKVFGVEAQSELNEDYTLEEAKSDLDLLASALDKGFAVPQNTDKEKSFVPPQGVRAAAERGLRLRREFGRGGTEVGVARARDLSNGRAISMDTARRMASFFARHGAQGAGDPPAPGEEPSAGFIAWLLWGGDPGKTWISRVLSSEQGKAELSIGTLVVEGGLKLPAQGKKPKKEPEATRAFKSESEEEFEPIEFQILKNDGEEERTVFGIVLEPETVDSQDDIYNEDEIRKTAFRFMERYQQFGLMHKKIIPSVLPLESYLAPVDFELNEQKVKKGTWLLRVRVLDDGIWKDVKSGRLTGFSIGGSAIRTPDKVTA